MRWFSYSQIESWKRCPTKWDYRHNQGYRPQRYQRALDVGIAWHDLLEDWWKGGEGTDAILAGWVERVRPQMEDVAFADWRETVYSDTVWLFERYTRHYEGVRRESLVLGAEIRFKLPLPHPDGKRSQYGLIGVLDLVQKHVPTGQVWMREFKSAADFGREELVAMDPQLTTYAWAAREIGLKLHGIVLDVSRKYRWKKIERDLGESFRQMAIDRLDGALDRFALDTYRDAQAIDSARRKGVFPRNIVVSPPMVACTICDFQDVCLSELSGDHEDAQYVLDSEFTKGAR